MTWIKILIGFCVSLILFSCEEEVVLDLQDAERRLVVEAILSNEQHALKASLSYSHNFYSEPEYARVGDATVVVSDIYGNYERLNVNENGVFMSDLWISVPGEKYMLAINVADGDILVNTIMPNKVEIKNVHFVPNPFFGADSLNAFVEVKDPVGEDNYFRLFVSKFGDPRLVEYYLIDDSFGKNDVISMPVYYKNFVPGDTVIVELRHLTKDTYKFYSTLSDNVSGSFNSVAPGNPVSNMPPDVMGHLVSYYVDYDTIVVPGAFDKLQ